MTIPEPEQGLVINYSCLWHHEHRLGQEKGRKDRPSVIVLAADRASDGATVVTVLAVTHTPPKDTATAVGIPATFKQHLDLDGQRPWIVVGEGNRFVWPGYDLRHIPNTGRSITDSCRRASLSSFRRRSRPSTRLAKARPRRASEGGYARPRHPLPPCDTAPFASMVRPY